jgi:RND family efflux transporter MFP subunit
MRTLNTILLLALAVAVSALAGDGHDHGDDGHSHAEAERPTIAVTQWTDRMELFMEYPVAVEMQKTRFAIHLTILDGFQPVREGSVTLVFDGAAGRFRVTSDELLREGTFAAGALVPAAGRYTLTITYEGPDLREEFVIDDFIVHEGGSVPSPEPGDASDQIGFLKEQQWKVPFATSAVEIRDIRRGAWAIAEVLPNPGAYAEIVAPVDGVVQVAGGDNLALPGSSVERGDVLAIIAPPVQGGGFVSSRLAYEQAKRDYERAQRLHELDAISERELEQKRNEYEARKAGFERLADEDGGSALALKAPIDGRIIEWTTRPGQLVRAGDKLMAVVDPSTIWLQVNVYQNDFREMGEPVGVYVNLAGTDGWDVSGDALRVLTTGGALDPHTRTVPVLLEIANPEGRLTINESTPVELYSSAGASAAAVPETAVYDDEGLKVVFVQLEGESFEKRRVVLGGRHAGWVTVAGGLAPGERVVTRGGYFVKLASTSAEIGHGHAH